MPGKCWNFYVLSETFAAVLFYKFSCTYLINQKQHKSVSQMEYHKAGKWLIHIIKHTTTTRAPLL